MMTAVSILIILAMGGLIFYFVRQIKTGQEIHLRHIPALDRLPHLMSQAVESGQKIHVSLGTGGVTDATTATTLAGLAVLDHLAERGCGSGAPPLVTVADPMVLPAAQDSLRRAYHRHGRPGDYRGTQVEMVAPQPTIYGLGASTRLGRKETAANVMLGSFGPEALLLAEPTAQSGIPQVAGTDDPQAMAMLMAAADDPIIGEELYAVPAYLNRKPAHLASLRAQDLMRLLVGASVLVAGVLAMFEILSSGSGP
jgi:hypothetical protein